MKSTTKQLKGRGKAAPEDIAALSGLPLEGLLSKLHSSDPEVRSAAAENLAPFVEQGSFLQICEVLDAIGYMAFYQTALATEKNGEKVIALAFKWKEQEMVRWKLALCLSAFPGRETEQLLLKLMKESSLIGQEAERSLRIREQRKRRV